MKPALVLSTDFEQKIEHIDQSYDGRYLLASVPIERTMFLFDLENGTPFRKYSN